MSRKERGVMKLIWNCFINSMKPNFNRPKLIGEDRYGTKYYETAIASRSSRKKPTRYFEAVDKDNFEPEMPPEWESWLRYRRTEPPTPEELERNYQITMSKKEKAAEIAAKYGSANSEKSEIYIDKKERKPFPVYDEYKNK